MPGAKVKQTGRTRVAVTEDRMQAWVQLVDMGEPGFVPPTPEEIYEALEATRVAITEDVQVRIDAYIKQICDADTDKGAETPANKFQAAVGRAPVEALDGRFEWLDAYRPASGAPKNDDGAVDYFSQNSIVCVAADTPIGHVVDPVDGASGLDVFGNEIPPRKLNGTPLQLGNGVRISNPETKEVSSTGDGRVCVEHGKLKLSDVLTIPGDVNFASGSIDSTVDVHISGTIQSNFTVKTTRSLTVDQAIEAAVVEVGEDLLVRRGVHGHDYRARLKVGGDVTLHFCEEVMLQAGGDVCVMRELGSCRIWSRGALLCENGTILGGQVYARDGVKAKTLGSGAAVRTRVSAGISAETLRRVRDMERKAEQQVKSAESVREKVQPLLANIRRLTAEQRETATELMGKADGLELDADDLREEQKRMLEEERPENTPRITVYNTVFPGTVIAIGPRETEIRKTMHGPMFFEERKVNDVTELVAVNEHTGSVTVLPSVAVDLDLVVLPEEMEQAQEEEMIGAEKGEQDDGEELIDN